VLIKQNLRFCSWRNEAQNIVSDTDWELTVKLNKHTTIALIGCFRFKVLRGAVNVNGANIDILSRRGQKDQRYTVYSPATHLISKIRGLDSANQVQFSNCEVPTPATGSDPLFSDIWAAQAEKGQNRSFSVVSRQIHRILLLVH
jgi:polynucleotide 5'-hydroxyl-kinase GRC3/NOL9